MIDLSRSGHRQLRLFAWLLLFVVMFAGNYLRYYLSAWNAHVLACGAVVLGLVLLAGFLVKRASLFRRGSPANAIEEWVETSCHLIPLFLFAAVGPSMPDLRTMSAAAFMPYPQRAAQQPRVAEKARPGEWLSASILDLHFSRERYEGEPIEVLGRVHVLTESDRKALPAAAAGKDVRVILYRYAITCCAADATPVSAVLQKADIANVRDDAWCKVRARSHFVAEGLDVPFLEVEAFEEVPEPINPYLSAVEEMLR